MNFDPGIKIGTVLTNDKMRSIFHCGNMGGMRRSKKTGTLVIISDETKGLYKDVWKNGVLHYTGMGKIGDQVLDGNQNRTLYDSESNGVEVHLFEVLKRKEYTYRGVVVLADEPYISRQLDDNKKMRNVWMFPVKLTDEQQSAEKRELEEKELVKISDEELARRTAVKNVGKKKYKADSTVYYRDPYLKEMVKRIAKGTCQLCGNKAPFYDKNNEPYLEEHHVIQLSDGGEDKMNNVVAICPNCHRKMHVLNDKNDVITLHKMAENNERMLERILAYNSKFV